MTEQTSTNPPPLAGIRILDFSRVIAGPLATQQLADLGATVIKVEDPVKGDDVRGFDAAGNPARSPFFLAFNRTKQSVALNLKDPRGQQLARDLAAQCDVLVQNFRPGVMARFGLDAAAICAQYPRLIYVSVSAYGESGAMRDRPGYDPVLQAESGMMELTGEPDGSPMRTALSLIDTLTAAHATTAVMAALMNRDRTGRGDYIDLALLDTAITALGNMGSAWLATGELPQRAGNNHIHATPNGLFRTATEPVYLAVASNRLFGEFCKIIGRPELATDPLYARPSERLKHRPQLKAAIESTLVTQPADYWLARTRHLPSGKVRTLDQALTSPEVDERKLLRDVTDDQTGETFRLFAPPFRFDGTPTAPAVAPPRLGQHTSAVLRALLGLDDAAVASLQEANVIRCE